MVFWVGCACLFGCLFLDFFFSEPDVIQTWEFNSAVCTIFLHAFVLRRAFCSFLPTHNWQMSPPIYLPVVNRFGHKDKMSPNRWSLLVLHKDVLGLSLDAGGQEQLPSLETPSLQL